MCVAQWLQGRKRNVVPGTFTAGNEQSQFAHTGGIV